MAEYDYDTPVEGLETAIFEKIIKSNENVNKMLSGFKTKVEEA